jgi:hypothetical protein
MMHACLFACIHVCRNARHVCMFVCIRVCMCMRMPVCRLAGVSVVPLCRAAARIYHCERAAAMTTAPVVFDPPMAFALGSAGGASCPSGNASVLNPADCKNAAAAAARPYGGAVEVTGLRSFDRGFELPTGCFALTVGVFFNNLVGQGNLYAQPLCAGAPEQQLPLASSVYAWHALLTFCFRTARGTLQLRSRRP